MKDKKRSHSPVAADIPAKRLHTSPENYAPQRGVTPSTSKPQAITSIAQDPRIQQSFVDAERRYVDDTLQKLYDRHKDDQNPYIYFATGPNPNNTGNMGDFSKFTREARYDQAVVRDEHGMSSTKSVQVGYTEKAFFCRGAHDCDGNIINVRGGGSKEWELTMGLDHDHPVSQRSITEVITNHGFAPDGNHNGYDAKYRIIDNQRIAHTSFHSAEFVEPDRMFHQPPRESHHNQHWEWKPFAAARGVFRDKFTKNLDDVTLQRHLHESWQKRRKLNRGSPLPQVQQGPPTATKIEKPSAQR